MENSSSDNKRIIKNTLFLYLRMFISMAVSLYTGRVVLNTLGVEDYGINNLVGGVIGMFSFINASMIGATSRFITYEMGRDDKQRLKDTFSTALNVHILIALGLFVLCETIGLWFVNTQLVIPDARIEAANWVYQFCVFSMMVSVAQTPFGACIVAHEKMGIYAYVEILNTILKLVILYVLLIGNMDKLILYGFLTLCVSIIIMSVYCIYSYRHFAEARFRIVWKKDILKPMLSFSGWDFFGNMSVMARGQGVSMLLNIFFGPAMNAAAGIATNVQNTISGFSSNVIMAVRPQLIKRYADGEFESMEVLMSQGIRISFILLTFLTVPLICEIHYVLKIWLGIVPDYACEFSALTLLFNLVGTFTGVSMIIIHATGKIKRMSAFNGCVYMMVIPFTYIAFKLGYPSWVPFAYNLLAVSITAISNGFIIRKNITTFDLKRFFMNDMLKCSALFIVVLLSAFSIHFYMVEGMLRLVVTICITIIATSIYSYFLLITTGMKELVINKFKHKFSILCKQAK